MNEWQRVARVGCSVKTLDELHRVVLLGANLVEIKTEKFAENGYPLWHYEDGKFSANKAVLEKLQSFAQLWKVQINLHMPIERGLDIKKDTGINVAFLEHHEVALQRFMLLEEIYREYKVGKVITVHPPTVSFNGKQLITEKAAIENARIFFERLDAIRLRDFHLTSLGLENQTDKKLTAGTLGYLPIQFKRILFNTRTIGLTIDSGHRRLTRRFKVSRFISLGIKVENFHFHGNKGEFVAGSYDDDQHLPPTKDNVTGYDNYLRFFRRHKTSVVLELASLKDFTDDELREIINDLLEKIQ